MNFGILIFYTILFLQESILTTTLSFFIQSSYDMRMCNYHDYYKNNSPKNRY